MSAVGQELPVSGAPASGAMAGDAPATDARAAAVAALAAITPPLTFTDTLGRLAEGQDLTRSQAAWALSQIVDGEAGDAEAAAFLMALRVKGETADEIAGLLETMRRLAVPVETSCQGALVDIVGTGGDRLDTFNISTTAAFVVAGAGVKVAKHGNRAASSRCGAADVMEALGIRIDLSPTEVAACIHRVGIGFMLASLHHPAMGRVGAVRRALGVRTVFNFLGPLTNPAGVRRQLLGVSAPDYLEVIAGALARVGCERALVVSGYGDMDELAVTGPSTVVEVRNGAAASPYTVGPADFGLERHDQASLNGGGPEENAVITRAVLAGAAGGPRDVVVLNAAAALYVAGACGSIKEGVGQARESIDSGRAARVLREMVAVTNELAGERQ